VKPWAISLRLFIAAIAFLAFALPPTQAIGQTSTIKIAIDMPSEGAAVANGRSVIVSGWAADPAGMGTGVDSVRIYLDATMESGGTLLGNAIYGDSRTDVATALGTSAVTNSGFNYTWTPTGLNPGPHTLYVYANSNVSGWGSKTVVVTVQGQAQGPAPAGAASPAPTSTVPQGVGTYWPGYPGPGMDGSGGLMVPGNRMGYPYPPRNSDFRGYPGGGYPGPGYPGPGYPGPGYPGGPGGDRVCIMIYPPPPGC